MARRRGAAWGAVKDWMWGWEWGAGGADCRGLCGTCQKPGFFSGSDGSRGRAVSRGATWVDWAVGRYLLQEEEMDGRGTWQETGGQVRGGHCFQAAVMSTRTRRVVAGEVRQEWTWDVWEANTAGLGSWSDARDEEREVPKKASKSLV